MNPETPHGRGDYQIQIWVGGIQEHLFSTPKYDKAKKAYETLTEDYRRQDVAGGVPVFIGLLYRPTGEAWPRVPSERSYWVQTYQS